MNWPCYNEIHHDKIGKNVANPIPVAPYETRKQCVSADGSIPSAALALGGRWKRGQERETMNHLLKKTWSIITSILVALVVILALLLVGARVVGLQVFSVLSGSMEPTYHTGALIYVKKVDPYTIQEGQVITFLLDENTTATHRVVEVVPDEEDASVVRFRTKGDSNEAEDGGLVHYKNVVGTPVFSIPYLGYVAHYIQHPPGMYVAISVGAVLLLLLFLPDVFAGEKKKQ